MVTFLKLSPVLVCDAFVVCLLHLGLQRKRLRDDSRSWSVLAILSTTLQEGSAHSRELRVLQTGMRQN